jgi:hypothetical protein
MGTMSLAKSTHSLIIGFTIGGICALLAGFYSAGFLAIPGFGMVLIAYFKHPEIRKQKRQKAWKMPSQELTIIKTNIQEGFSESYNNKKVLSTLKLRERTIIERSEDENPFRSDHIILKK